MQTFLPYPDFSRSASVLDNRRLGKQRVEAKQIYLALTNPTYGWQNHPAVKMWRGYEAALLCYGRAICNEWHNVRHFDDTLWAYFHNTAITQKCYIGVIDPPWLGNPNFHLSHQSNLLRKDPVHYRQFFPDVQDNLPYIWPVN